MLSKINFGPGRGNSTGDLVIDAIGLPDTSRPLDLAIFTDSRGARLEDPRSGWARMLFESRRGWVSSAILAVRPRDCTVFFTLVNFLRLNGLYVKDLVIQVGLVDFTPKKMSVIDDIMAQASPYFDGTGFEIGKLSRYSLSSGETEYLHSIDMDRPDFIGSVSDCLAERCANVIMLGSNEVTPDIRIDRKRPPEFFPKIKESNEFLRKLSGECPVAKYVDPLDRAPLGADAYSTDGVHYTAEAHIIVRDRLSGILRDTEDEC